MHRTDWKGGRAEEKNRKKKTGTGEEEKRSEQAK